MKRFPKDYRPPGLTTVQDGHLLGWSALCSEGNAPATAGCTTGYSARGSCSQGRAVGIQPQFEGGFIRT